MQGLVLQPQAQCMHHWISFVIGTGEGQARNAVLPDVYAEDVSAAADFLGTRRRVNRERIGVLGTDGSGSFVVSAAKLDPGTRAVATVSTHGLGAVNRDGLDRSQSLKQRKEAIAAAAEQRYVAFAGGKTKHVDGMHEPCRRRQTRNRS